MKKDFSCKECNNAKFEKQGDLITHLKKVHNGMRYEDYVLKWFFNNEYPKCKCGCGTDMQFHAHHSDFFCEYTSNHFPRKPHTEDTKEKIKINSKKALMEKYGVENPMDLRQCIDKISRTKFEKYGDPNYNNMEKNKRTKKEKYGDENYQNSEKMIQTNLERYGARMFTATEEGKKRVAQTKLEKYGNPKYQNMEKVAQTKLERYGYTSEFLDKEWRRIHNSTTSAIERKICELLGADPKFSYMGKIYDMCYDGKYIIEIDGEHFHPKSISNLNLIQLQNIVNDFIKTNNLANNPDYILIRISTEVLHKNLNLDAIDIQFIIDNSYSQDFTLSFYQKILAKEYLLEYFRKKGKDNLKKYIRVFWNFLQTFQPTFPEIPCNEEIGTVINTISKYDISKIKKSEFEFRNNCSNVGVNYLKSQFRSYWHSSFKGRKSPIEAWADPTIMKPVIEYRVGLNDSNEVFDFTLHQMVRGLSARRYTISFFKPLLAAAIYSEFLGDMQNPVVLDPCAGFGGRMLGFKSRYPNGTYIGVEPNIDTFNELNELSKNFTNVILYNCKIEDLDQELLPENIDLTFTSIPYYDLETYSNPMEYGNTDEWRKTFLSAVRCLPNLIINIPQQLRFEFEEPCEEYRILQNTSHFDKGPNTKFEYLLKFC